MPDITITLKDAEAVRLLSDFFYYSPIVKDGDGNDIPNPEGRIAFVRRRVREQLQIHVLAQKKREAVSLINIVDDGEVI